METKPDGGPAFPGPAINEDGSYLPLHHTGMSLRDWFAGQIMQGLLEGVAWDVARDNAKRCAEVAYVAADAMLAARGGRDE